jgi:hypothetical protein
MPEAKTGVASLLAIGSRWRLIHRAKSDEQASPVAANRFVLQKIWFQSFQMFEMFQPSRCILARDAEEDKRWGLEPLERFERCSQETR